MTYTLHAALWILLLAAMGLALRPLINRILDRSGDR
jgi:hypothetical protein